jgi:hypothetical protein
MMVPVTQTPLDVQVDPCGQGLSGLHWARQTLALQRNPVGQVETDEQGVPAWPGCAGLQVPSSVQISPLSHPPDGLQAAAHAPFSQCKPRGQGVPSEQLWPHSGP